jgi:D-alanyl-D-alanine carboxypeptidase
MSPERSLLFSFFGSKKGVLTIAILLISLIFTGVSPALAASKKKSTADNPKYASFIMDADTGVILHQRFADKKLHPASLTKVMTLLLLFEAIDRGDVSYDSRIRISKHAAAQSPSKLGLSAGSSIKVRDAIGALVTKSANDIAVAVAEHVGGTETGFARMMTARAQQLGMSSTIFKNASGLHNPGQISTARDMAKLARVVIVQYPEYYRHFGTKNFSYQGANYHNHNRLMSSYKGMDGMKTGYIGPSGFNLVASAVRGNNRLIGVVFGGRSANSRNAHMAMLLDRGFAQLRTGNVPRIASAEIMTMPDPVKAPTPARKPDMVLAALSSLDKVEPAGVAPLTAPTTKTPSVQDIQNSGYGEMIGEGDYDPAMAQRIQTGLVAISAVKGREAAKPAPGSYQVASLTAVAPATVLPPQDPVWSIQIGAFTSRAATDQALHAAAKKLPVNYASAAPAIAPLRTKDGWLFRARLSGYTKEQAFAACKHLKDCLPVAPNN